MKYNKLKLKVTLQEPMLGTVPMDKEIYKNYIQNKAREEGVPEDQLEKELLSVEDMEEKGWTAFHKDEKGLFILDYLFKGFLKNAGNVLKEQFSIKGLRQKVQNYVFVLPRKIYLNKEKADGVIERPLRAETPQGPRVCLARSDFVNAGTSFEVELKILEHKEVNLEIVKELLDYGQLCGLGQFRSGSYGQFTYEIM